VNIGRARNHIGLLVLWAGALACAPAIGAPLGLFLSDKGERTAILRDTLSTYALPIGPWADGAMLTLRTEGAVETSAWRIEAPGATTMELLAPLRTQLIEGGFRLLFECAALECGGFDFRYSTTVLPEPEMHVDLGDYRYVAAERGSGDETEHVTLLVSRSRLAGFVQMIRVSPPSALDNVLSSKAPASSSSEAPAPPVAADDPAQSLSEGVMVLDDLIFGSGAADLGEGDFPSLRSLAGFLDAHPQTRIALVGHTDTSGSLEANKALSQRRADAVRQRLVRQYGIAETRIEAHGVGFLSPRASNATETGRARNRRVEAIITSTQ